jgi:hypothetical protein
MSDNQNNTGTQQGGNQSSSNSGTVYRDSKDPLAANLSWSSIKTAWQELKKS